MRQIREVLPIETESIRQTSYQFGGRLAPLTFDRVDMAGRYPELVRQRLLGQTQAFAITPDHLRELVFTFHVSCGSAAAAAENAARPVNSVARVGYATAHLRLALTYDFVIRPRFRARPISC
jgi:hypothetical protein